MTFPRIDDRAHGGKEVSSPVRAKPVCHFPKDRAQANGLLAGVIGGGNGGIVQKEEQVVLDRVHYVILTSSPLEDRTVVGWPKKVIVQPTSGEVPDGPGSCSLL